MDPSLNHITLPNDLLCDPINYVNTLGRGLRKNKNILIVEDKIESYKNFYPNATTATNRYSVKLQYGFRFFQRIRHFFFGYSENEKNDFKILAERIKEINEIQEMPLEKEQLVEQMNELIETKFGKKPEDAKEAQVWVWRVERFKSVIKYSQFKNESQKIHYALSVQKLNSTLQKIKFFSDVKFKEEREKLGIEIPQTPQYIIDIINQKNKSELLNEHYKNAMQKLTKVDSSGLIQGLTPDEFNNLVKLQKKYFYLLLDIYKWKEKPKTLQIQLEFQKFRFGLLIITYIDNLRAKNEFSDEAKKNIYKLI